MTGRPYPKPATPRGGRLLDARLSLLDRQVLDVGGDPVNVVDDVHISDVDQRVLPPDSPPPTVLALVHGPVVLERIFGGRRPRAHFDRTEWAQLARIDSAVHLAVPIEAAAVGWLEGWLRENVIGRIPGGRDVPR